MIAFEIGSMQHYKDDEGPFQTSGTALHSGWKRFYLCTWIGVALRYQTVLQDDLHLLRSDELP
jgi:hypothetical protein